MPASSTRASRSTPDTPSQVFLNPFRSFPIIASIEYDHEDETLGLMATFLIEYDITPCDRGDYFTPPSDGEIDLGPVVLVSISVFQDIPLTLSDGEKKAIAGIFLDAIGRDKDLRDHIEQLAYKDDEDPHEPSDEDMERLAEQTPYFNQRYEEDDTAF